MGMVLSSELNNLSYPQVVLCFREGILTSKGFISPEPLLFTAMALDFIKKMLRCEEGGEEGARRLASSGSHTNLHNTGGQTGFEILAYDSHLQLFLTSCSTEFIPIAL